MRPDDPFDGATAAYCADIEDAHGALSRPGECRTSVAAGRNERDEPFHGDSFVPGTKRVYIKTWGCSHNHSDSEYMAGALAQAGYQITERSTAADVWLLNSCTVKTPSEDQLRALVHGPSPCSSSAHGGQRPPIVLAGCVPQAAPATKWIGGMSVVGVQQTDRVVEVVEQTLNGNTVRLLGAKRRGGRRLAGAELHLPKIRRNPLVEILAINTGCLNHCTYCKTKQARGDLASYPIDQLVSRAVSAFQDGVKEIWLTSEDLGAYGRDLGVTLPDLLTELVRVIPEGCMMRLGMTNPPYILDHLPEMCDVLRHERVYAFLHVPVQSGSDPVLADMRREYTVAQFEHMVDYLRRYVPGIHIATDVICGFPTESREDHEETYSLIERHRFPSVFINQFYPRPGTPAARLPRVDTKEARRRTKSLSELFRSYHPYADRVGRVYTALVTEWASDKRHLVGHNKSYEQVLLEPTAGAEADLMGATVQVRVTSAASKFAMHAVLVDGRDGARPAAAPCRWPPPLSQCLPPLIAALCAYWALAWLATFLHL